MSERKDHQTHDFTSEWAKYFPGRLKELYEKDVEDLKVRLRERFVLPMHNRELKDKRYFVKGNYDANEPEIDIPPVPPIIDNSNYRDYINRGTRSRSTSRSRSSRSNNRKEMDTDEKQCEILSGDDDCIQQNATKNKPNTDDDDRDDFGPLTVISVLRLLTVLEDNLGPSLGPRVVDLLSKALTLKKLKPNDSDEILLTVENCIFLETCVEKLKGQVLAGVIGTTKLRAVRQAIKDITAIVRKANEERAKNPPAKSQVQRKVQSVQKVATATTKQQTPPTIPTTSKVNANNPISINKQPVSQSQHPTVMSQAQKKELATKLAAALAAQGKTDISTENCEKLIEVYAMIDKKKSELENHGNKPSLLTDTLTDILNSGNYSALSTLIQCNKQQTNISSTSNQNFGDLRNQLNQNQLYNQRYQNLMSNNYGFNSNQNLQNNNFNQLANFDTSLNINKQQLNNFTATGGTQSTQFYQNPFVQGNNQNWITGNNAGLLQQLQCRGMSNLSQFPLTQSNLMLGNNQNLLSQTLLNSTQMQSNLNAPNARIDTGSQNSPAYATGTSYRGNTNRNNNDTVSYPNLWHRQNQQQQFNSGQMSGNQNIRNTENPAISQLLNQQQNFVGNRTGANERNLPNNSHNTRNNFDTTQRRRSDFGGRK